MADRLCDICNKRPATTTVRVQRDGRTQVIQVCDVDYRRLRDQRGYASPFKSLFSEDPFGDIDPFFEDFGSLSSRFGYPIPRHREAIDIERIDFSISSF